MEEIILAEPTLEFEDDAIQYRDECVLTDGCVYGDGGLLNASTYKNWLEHLQIMSNESTVPSGLVPSSTYFAIDKKNRKIVDNCSGLL